MYSWLRPLLFRLEPETAHRITLSLLERAHRLGQVPRFVSYVPSRHVEVIGLDFASPVGLAIVQRIAKRLGWVVSVQSQRDQGSTFALTFRASSRT